MTSEKREGIRNRVYNTCVIVSWVFVLFMAVMYVIGQFGYKHDFFDVGFSKTLDIGWDYVTDDGQTGTCVIPKKIYLDKGVGIELNSRLPDDITDGMYMVVMAGRNIDIYIDDEIRFHHDGSENELPGKIVKCERYPIPLSGEDAGKSIRIVKREQGVVNGNLFEIKYGDLYMINREFVDSNIIKFAMAIVLMFVAIVLCISNFVLDSMHNLDNLGLRFLGYGMMAISVWILTDSYLYQMVFDNVFVDGLISFMVVPILPIPFMRYLNVMQERRFESSYNVVMIVLLIDAFVTAFLHFTDILSYEGTMSITNGLACLGAIMLLLHIFEDIKNGYIKKYSLIAIGVAGLVVFAILEVVFINLHFIALNGIWLTVGMFFLLTLSVLHSVKEIFAAEQNRRNAIEANIVKSTFLANMSHEIRTPINSIMGMNEMILRETDDSDIREYAEHIKRSGNLLLSIIGDVLDVTRIEAGKLNIVKNPYNTAVLIGDAVEILREHATPKGLETKLDIDEELPAVLEGDQNHIKQVIINLITNACKYTHEGQISLKISSGGYGTTEAGQKICDVIFEVSDTGIGIKKENIDRLFDSFTRLDEKKNSQIQGTGLGLTIVKSLVDAMGGEVSVASTYGMGSVFTVKMPQRVISESPIEDNWRDSVKNRRGENDVYKVSFTAPEACVLAVDDNGSNLMIIKQLLKATKTEIDLADTGDEAISLADRKHYDVILLDHMMPEPDGVEVLKHIKSDSEGVNYNTPVIVLTANAVGGSRQEYLQYGFDDYISKPVDGTTLEQMLMRYLPDDKVHLPEETTAAATDTKPDETAAEDSLFKDGEFKKIARLFGDENFAYEVMHKVAEDTLKQLDKMKSDIMVDRYEDYAINAHAIKGMMASVYYEPLRIRSMEHEKAAKNGDIEFIKRDFDDYSADCREFCDKILSGEDK
ncbi:MAG: response regulator [Lachnospiraceae bacterium]|nr:response regulator [Lachnospiraceae bacterium]